MMQGTEVEQICPDQRIQQGKKRFVIVQIAEERDRNGCDEIWESSATRWMQCEWREPLLLEWASSLKWNSEWVRGQILYRAGALIIFIATLTRYVGR